MKTAVYKRVAAALAIATTVALTGCGSSKNNQTNIPPGGIPGPSVPGVGAGICVPLATGQIGFSGQNLYWFGSGIRGGIIPGSFQSVGQMTVGSGGGAGPYMGQTAEATIQMQVLPAGYGGVPQVGMPPGMQPGMPPGMGGMGGQTSATVTGMLSLSGFTIQRLINKAMLRNPGMFTMPGAGFPGGQPYPNTGYPNTGYNPGMPYQNVCINSVAMDVGLRGAQIWGGHVFLYLNNDPSFYDSVMF